LDQVRMDLRSRGRAFLFLQSEIFKLDS
jgi:hypothetical protein